LGKKLSLSVWNHLTNEFNIIGVRKYIDRVVISTWAGSSFLQTVSVGDASTASNVTSTIMGTDFFDDLISYKSLKWSGIHPNPLSKSGTPQVIPLIRPIQSTSSSQVIGWVYMDIPESVIVSSLKNYVLEGDDALYISIGNDMSYRFCGDSLVSDIVPEDTVFYTLPQTGWKISYMPSKLALAKRMHSYKFLIVLIFMVILFAGIVLSISLHRSITRPVEMLIKRLLRIGSGDFSRDSNIEWDNELGEIGRGINNLSENVSDLMEKRLLDEKTRHDLEYQVLQSQINPHFLYNTLNTIKWMATIQGADGIADMSTALSRLMKNISKTTEDLITLKDEFSLVDDYFTIMKYRYGGTIEMEYKTDDDLLLEQKINRFSLQPIVENAIFHGIEPRGNAGKITIHTYLENKNVIIDVTDNGIGMTAEAIDAVLNGSNKSSTEFFKQIGVANVNDRIKYTFGDSYGIKIESEVGVYTTMRFVLPYNSSLM
jgi:two-component system sensor histidine kinase YesM